MTNTLIRASAGSGKTFQLSNRYIDIVFRKNPVDSILASTFTRKAAGEIQDRILLRLAAAALDESKNTELNSALKSSKRIDLTEIREILGFLARNLYRLRISTLDSFFNKIASSFSLELGFPPGWTILDDTVYGRLLGEAIRVVLADSQKNNVRRLMHLMQKGEQNRNITQELFDLATDLLPLIKTTDKKVWDNDILCKKEPDAMELQAVLEQLSKADLPLTTKKTPNQSVAKMRDQLVAAAMSEDWDKIALSVVVQRAARGEAEISFGKAKIEGSLQDAIRDLADYTGTILLNQVVWQTRATRELLELIAKACDEILLRERGLRFEDVTERLARSGTLPGLDHLAHRMDAKTEHLLLDEFQDTSISQWDVLRPIGIDASTLAKGSFFCVGDLKQAIYAWRGGVADIFDSIEKEIQIDEILSLDVSYRSSKVVLNTVNKLFESIASNEALVDYPEAVKTWTERFKEHKPGKDLPGYCVMEIADVPAASTDGEQDDELTKDELLRDHTIKRIAELHAKKPNASIGVLVARNKKIGELISGLKTLGIEASEEGGNPLTDSAAVQHVLSAMILADHPGDRIARFHLGNGPLAKCLGLEKYTQGVDDDRLAAECSRRIRKDILEKGYGELIEDWIRELAPTCTPREFERLEKLLEAAYRFQENATGIRTDRFVEMVRNTKVESPSASKIRIMTIHKSKGLEFDIVVLPDLDNRLVKQAPKVVVGYDGKVVDDVKFVLRYVGEETRAFLPDSYRMEFDKRKQREIDEQLAVLYVALTRAAHELVMIVSPLGKTMQEKQDRGEAVFPASFAGILRACYKNYFTSDQSLILFQDGNPDWYKQSNLSTELSTDTRKTIEPETLDCRLAPNDSAPRRNIPRVSPSSLERFPEANDEEIDLPMNESPFSISGGFSDVYAARPSSAESAPGSAGVTGLNRDDAMLRGTAIHACFEHGLRMIPWLDESEPELHNLEEVVRLAAMGKKGKLDSAEVIRAFRNACKQPNIRKALSRSSYPNQADFSVEVEHERCFSLRLPEQKILRGSIDRLVVFRKGGKVVGLEIIDYKTDRLPQNVTTDDFVREHLNVYTPQLNAYRDGMSLLFRLDKSKIRATILFVDVDRVVRVD